MKRSTMRRQSTRVDPVTPEMALAVLTRDGGCVAVKLGQPANECRGRLTLDHIKDKPKVGDPPAKRQRIRAPSDMAHLAAVCEWHHLYGWATSHRPALREYLQEVNA